MLDAKAMAEATADIVRRHVEDAQAPLLKRIEELEARTPQPGEQGERGDQGERGEKGLDGSDGIGLAAALINRDGELVVTTTDGQVRELGIVVGKDGRDGVDGKDGASGVDGRDGTAGERGEKGDAGEPGRDGRDGREITPRGLYDATAEYAALDIVALNGGSFMAKRDNPGDCPGDGWMLLVQRGKRGETGERGEKGDEGKEGKAAAEMVGLGFDADKFEVFVVMDDGSQHAFDFHPIAEKILEALRNQ